MQPGSVSYGFAALSSFTAIDMPAANHEAGANILPGDAKNGRQFPVSNAAFIDLSRGLGIECRGLMCAVVRGCVQHFEVFNSVVGLLAVLVVNVLVRAKCAAKVAFHDVSVFIDLPAVNADHAVAGGVQPVLEQPRRMAFATAKRPLVRADERGLSCELGAASRACACYFHGNKVACPSSRRKIEGLL